jgi:hypothetical protein
MGCSLKENSLLLWSDPAKLIVGKHIEAETSGLSAPGM